MNPLRSSASHQFYFNHCPDTTTTIDSSIYARYFHGLFARRIAYGLRMTTSFLFGGFIAYDKRLRTKLADLNFLVCILSILIIQDTLGQTLENCYLMTKSLLPISIFLYIIQHLGLSYRSYLATEFSLLITTFYISYKCPKIQTRRVVLLINVIFFSTIVNNQQTSTIFVFELLKTYIIGLIVAIITSIIIFPLTATLDIENRFIYGLLNLNQLYILAIHGYLSQNKILSQVSLKQCEIIQQYLCENLIMMQIRLNQVKYEPVKLIQLIFRRHRIKTINLTLYDQVELIRSFMFYVNSMIIMVNSLTFNDRQQYYSKTLKTSLIELTSIQSSVLIYMTKLKMNKNEFYQLLKELNKTFINLKSMSAVIRSQRLQIILNEQQQLDSNDLLSISFFLFQLSAIVRLIQQYTIKINEQQKQEKTDKC
ncbi:unnamed protein product, partial [Didymodactylos carnosus]